MIFRQTYRFWVTTLLLLGEVPGLGEDPKVRVSECLCVEFDAGACTVGDFANFLCYNLEQEKEGFVWWM